jgi:hypothetical protein
MNTIKIFKVKKEHILLARRMEVSWWEAEYGAPGINPKRPYGNSDVKSDICKILGCKENDNGEYSESDLNKADAIHQEMETVLQIILSTGKFQAGEYQAEDYSRKWKKKK